MTAATLERPTTAPRTLRSTRQIPRALGSVAEARRWATACMETWALTDIDQDAVQLVVSELAANAVLHGLPRLYERDRIVLGACLGRGRLRITVHDPSPTLFTWPTGPAAAGSEHGRGLILVTSLADHYGVQRGRTSGKCAWCAWSTSTQILGGSS